MNEVNLNSIINRSIGRMDGAFNHKISDPSGGMGSQNPFDGFGIINGKPLYYEAKIIKGGIYSFNFNKIEVHQYKNWRGAD